MNACRGGKWLSARYNNDDKWFHQSATIPAKDSSAPISKSYITTTEYKDMSIYGVWDGEAQHNNNAGKYICIYRKNITDIYPIQYNLQEGFILISNFNFRVPSFE